MIVASLLLILVAVVLLVAGLAGGSSVLLVVSIAASLLAAVALVVGARQAAADRAAAQRPQRPSRTATPPADPAFAYGPPVEPEIPVQHVPPTVDAGGPGWRQPPEPPVTDVGAPVVGPGMVPATDDDEPGAQDVPPAQAALVARLDAEVRVVDGRPRYHLAHCAHLAGREHEPLPVGEAVELGFTPCAHCAPDTVLLADADRI
ncbi:hypothetical protein GA0070606_5037 [Micromonospora citrea]|uniref:Clumping factor A n=1 Tax=Micromonospora citrea TaxID=47855 RepID=A0A1C6VTQ8_9ACTN|nr:hypothetical protein [Micromonospora citrea]SCL69300.1 hypothetical protein GA0070606_5037 [Micromonospora citrea]